MKTQPNLFSDAQPSPPVSPAPQPVAHALPLWLQRISLLILVLFCVYLGVLVAILPWWPAVWERNQLLLAHPKLWDVLQLGFVRGLISGVGLVNIWIGIAEAVHYREDRDPGSG